MNAPASLIGVVEIEQWLRRRVAAALRIAAGDVALDALFPELGMDSLAIVQIAGEAGRWLGCSVDPNVSYEYPTIRELAAHLATLGRR